MFSKYCIACQTKFTAIARKTAAIAVIVKLSNFFYKVVVCVFLTNHKLGFAVMRALHHE